MENLIEQFDTQVNAMLDSCTTLHTPTICNLISTPTGRKKVFDLIQKKVIQEKITIGQAIVSIEQEFNPNSYAQ
jgi:hypothetical protein